MNSKSFDDIAEYYERGILWRRFFMPLYKAILDRIEGFESERVVEIGCGTGEMAVMLSNRGFAVTGIDSSEKMLDEARNKSCNSDNPRFLKAQAEDMPFGECEFDTAVSSLTFHHMKEKQRSLREMRRVLCPGGRIMLFDMCYEGIFGKLSWIAGRSVASCPKFFTRKELGEMMKEAGYGNVRCRIIKRMPPVMMAEAIKPETRKRAFSEKGGFVDG